MATATPGLRMGPLDPDATERFGHVSAGAAAVRSLLRAHAAMYPAELLQVLTRRRNDPRTAGLNAEEVVGAIDAYLDEADEALPDGAELVRDSFTVRGEEGNRQFVTFVYTTESGRTGKGFVPYTDDYVPDSIDGGDEQVAIDKARESGQPWVTKQMREAIVSGGGEVTQGDDGRQAEALAAAEAKVAELESRLAEYDSQGPSPDEQHRAEAEREAAGEATSLAEPWPGYDAEKAADIRKRIQQANDPAQAQAAIAWETAPNGPDRATVISAANEVLDRARS